MSGIHLTLWSVMLAFGALHGFILTAVFIRSGIQKKHGAWLLAALTGSIALILTSYVLSISGLYGRWPHLARTTFPCWFIIGPAIYLYIRSLSRTDRPLRARDTAHLIPALLAFANSLPFLVLGREEKLAAMSTPSGMSPGTLALIVVFAVITPLYVIRSMSSLRDLRAGLKRRSADTRIEHIVWLERLLWTLVVYFATDILTTLSMLLAGNRPVQVEYVSVLAMTLIIYLTAVTCIRQPADLFGQSESTTEPTVYARSLLEDDESAGLSARLAQLMEHEQLYANPGLKLRDLADAMQISETKLSQLLSQKLGTNFFELINSHRVSAATERLVAPESASRTIAAVAREAGFASNASFYRVFKKHVGLTPSQYIEGQRETA